MGEYIVKENIDPTKDNEFTFEERYKQLEDLKEIDQEKVDQKKKSIFNKFVQFNLEGLPYLATAMDTNPKAVRILFFFIEHMDRYNALVCSYKVIQEALGISTATIQRSIKFLKDKGFIYIYKTGTANVYVLSNKLVWQNYGDKNKYCKFPANVMLAASEQEKEMINNFTKRSFVSTKYLKETESED